jgi:hypothetical protein
LKKLCTLKQVKAEVNMINTWSMHYGEKKTPVIFFFYLTDCGYYISTSFHINTTSNFPIKNAKQCGTHLESADIQRLHANGVLLV